MVFELRRGVRFHDGTPFDAQAVLRDLSESLGLACLFIAHDLAAVCQLADRVAVMCLGRIVEQAPTALLTGHPRHPHTQALLAAVPRLDTGQPATRKRRTP